jgi:hypothetical protein
MLYRTAWHGEDITECGRGYACAAQLYPSFADIFGQLRSADRAMAQQCLEHYIDCLRGPPNRRTRDARSAMATRTR